MAYYMRSNNASSHGNYMMSNSSMQGGYLMHSAKGSEWKKPHKYLDKRWIDGAWHYLYEIPKEYAQRAGEAAKDTAEKVSSAAKNVGENIQKRHNYAVNEMKKTAKNVGENIQKRHNYAVNEMKKTAEKAVDTVKDTAQKATKAAKDFKDYSKNVDSRVNRYKEDIQKREDIAKSTTDRQNAAELKLLNNAGKAEEAYAEAKKYERELKSVESVYGKNSEQARVMRELYEDATQTAREISKEDDDSQIKAVNAVNAHARNEAEKEQSEKGLETAERDKESAKYKASKALNAIDDMIDDASGSAKQGLQWLKNQLESGNKWAMNALADIEEKGSSALATGSAFLKNLLGKEKPKENSNTASQSINISNSSSSSSSSSASGRKYSGVGQKAEVKDKKEIHAAEVARNNAEAEVTYARKTYGFNSEEYKRAVSKFQRKNEEYLNLLNGGPVSNNNYNGRPSKRK